MTTRRLRDLRRLFEAEAQVYGARVRIERTNGHHFKAIFNVDGYQTFIIAAYNPHNTYTFGRKVRAQVRRTLRSLTTQSVRSKESESAKFRLRPAHQRQL